MSMSPSASSQLPCKPQPKPVFASPASLPTPHTAPMKTARESSMTSAPPIRTITLIPTPTAMPAPTLPPRRIRVPPTLPPRPLFSPLFLFLFLLSTSLLPLANWYGGSSRLSTPNSALEQILEVRARGSALQCCVQVYIETAVARRTC